MAKETRTINLLPNKGEGLLSQFLSWALNIGRLLIIITETLALGTFIYRFSLDMKIVDLHDQIKSESYIVGSFKNSEITYRDILTRLALAKQYDATSKVTPNVFKDIVNMGRGKVTFHSVFVSNDVVKLEIQAPSADNLARFVNQLKTYPALSSISIDKVENKTSSALVTVAITAQMKK